MYLVMRPLFNEAVSKNGEEFAVVTEAGHEYVWLVRLYVVTDLANTIGQVVGFET